MNSLNAEDVFLLQWQKVHTSTSPVSQNFLRKELFNTADGLSYIIMHSKNNNFDFIPATIYILEDIENKKTNRISVNALTSIAYYCLEAGERLTDEHFKSIAEAKPETYHSKKLTHIELQIKVAKLIKDENTKIDILKKIFKNILDISNDSKNQAFIFKQWLKLKKSPHEISEYIPLMINQKPSISSSKEEFNTVTIDANKLASDFKIPAVCAYNFSINFLTKFKQRYSDDILYTNDNKNNSTLFLLVKSESVAELLTVSFEYFVQKMGANGKWKDMIEIREVLNKDWGKIDLAHKLDKNLVPNVKEKKNLKI